VPQQKEFFKTALNKPYLLFIKNNYDELEKYVSYLYDVIQKLKMCTDKTTIKKLNKGITDVFKAATDDKSETRYRYIYFILNRQIG